MYALNSGGPSLCRGSLCWNWERVSLMGSNTRQLCVPHSPCKSNTSMGVRICERPSCDGLAFEMSFIHLSHQQHLHLKRIF